MKNGTRMISLLLTVLLLLPAAAPFRGFAAAAASTAIVDLQVEDLTNPVGIDVENPVFSWKMQSDVVGQAQTAYQITVASDAELTQVVWDSGKQTDSRSVGIVYHGQPLLASTTYYWQVCVWDKDQKELYSPVASFEMGLLGHDAWEGSQWIQLGSNRSAESSGEPVHYTVEAEILCTSGAIGLVYNAVDSGNFYMMQLNTTVQSGKVLFRPHTWAGGAYSTYSAHIKDVTSVTGTPATIQTTPVRVKIDVTDAAITTYLNDQQVDVTNQSEIGTKGPAPQIAGIGVRTATGEAGAVDNLKLTDYTQDPAGEVLCNYTFEEENPYPCGRLKNGRLTVSSSLGVVLPMAQSGVATFRKELTPKKAIASAKLYAAGLGVFDLFVDGTRVGHLQEDGSYLYDELKPGYTHTSKRTQYYTYDVTQLFQEGETSTLSAHVTSGWWSGAITSYHGKNEALRIKLLLNYTDGDSEWICTDPTWKTTRTGPILYSDIFGGETYNGGADLSFRYSGYDDSNWANASINQEFSGQICAVVGPTSRVRWDLELHPQSVTVCDGVTGAAEDRYGTIHVTGRYGDEAFVLKANETAVIDLGQNFAGWEEIAVQGEAGTVLTMRHSEMLNDNEGLLSRGNDGPEGSVYVANLRSAAAVGRYILSGQDVERYHASTVFYGFRYVEITTTRDVTIYGVTGQVVTSVAKNTGDISTSNDKVNQLISNIQWGQYSNYLSVPTDCPQRDERKGWTADTQVFSTSAMYNADVKGFLRKYMADMNDSQVTSGSKTGAYADTAPYVSSADIGQLGWADAGIIIPYNLYKMYGDARVIEENYANMQAYIDVYLATTDHKGGSQRYGDWLAYESNDSEIKTMLGVSFYAWDAQMMAQMAQIIGREEDAARYQALYQEEKAYFQAQFVNADGSLKRTEQTVCLYALKLDLLPDDASREQVKQALLENIQRNGLKLQTGFLGTAVLMQTLSDLGETATAYQLLLQRGNPSWLYSVDQGATTIWERWNSYTLENGFGPVNMNSFNHYAYGAVAEWMYGYMAGILYDVETPGFQHMILQPSPDRSIRAVNCTYESAYGQIVSNWEYRDGQFLYHAIVPANTTATIYLPVAEGAAVTVNGKAASAVSKATDGLEYLGTVDGAAAFEAVSGTYDFATDATEYCYVTLEADASVECWLQVDGEALQAMPSGVALEKGKEVTLTATPKDADYACVSWSGDQASYSNSITFTVSGDITLSPVYAYVAGENLALHKSVTSSNGWETGGWSHAGLVDGITNSSSSCPGYTTTKGSSTDVDCWVEIDLGENQWVDRIQLYPRTDSLSVTGGVANFPVNFTLEVREEGTSQYTQVAEQTGFEPVAGQPAVVEFAPVLGRYIRLRVTKVSAAASADSAYHYLQLAEMCVYADVETVNQRIEALPDPEKITEDDAQEAMLQAQIAKAAYRVLTAEKQAQVVDADRMDAVMAAAEAILSAPAVLLGDLNQDGNLSVTDVVLLRKAILAGAAGQTPAQLTIGDLNSDGALSVTDVVLLRKAILNQT